MSHLGEKDFTNRLDYIQAQKDLIHKGLYGGLPCEDVIMKGGEGSKGGKVIGHTKSGKPIYMTNGMNHRYEGHSAHDHADMADHHKALASKARDLAKKGGGMKAKDDEKLHNQISFEHNVQAEKKKDIAPSHENDSAETKAFEHHRMMAGYHASKEQKIADTQEDFRSSSDKQLHESADEMEAERKKHQDKEHEHKEKAKKLHDPKKHGDWNSTIPKEKDALEYGAKHDVKKAEGDNFDGTFDKAMTAEAGEGVTQKESVEHNPKDMQNAKPSDLKKAYEVLGLGDLIEKAEGARGGEVIGHTESGKPIYKHNHVGVPMNTSHYQKFTSKDHRDAAKLYQKRWNDANAKGASQGERGIEGSAMQAHTMQANKKSKKEQEIENMKDAK